MKKALIIGAGPAGLTAAFEILKQMQDVEVTVLEETDCIGGISKTVCYNGNRMDMGGHRFFSKMPEVNDWWQARMPMQGAGAKDDVLLHRTVPLAEGGPDPEKTDCVFLTRHRVSRIFFEDKFYDYPVSLKKETIANMGLLTTMQVGMSYLWARIKKRPDDNLENFYINRFGKKLYSMFFEYYTENLWGRHPRDIDASWGSQRVKGLSVVAILKDMAGKALHISNRKVETSLIESFRYPKFGPGQLWEETAAEIEKRGGTIIRNAKVVALKREGEKINAVAYEKDGKTVWLEGDYVLSSMPLRDLVGDMNDVPKNIADIAAGLPYRDYMTLGVLVSKLNLKNNTSLATVGNIVPDCWIYVQDRRVKMGRIQIYNNWSPYLVKDLENTVWLGLEYFANEGDALWGLTDEKFRELAIAEMMKIGLVSSGSDILDSHVERVKKAYPAYFDTYAQISELVQWLDTIPNLYCIGRNGQHRYNNMDHSMATAFEAVKAIKNGSAVKDAIWNVNTEKEYHEEKHEA